MGAFAYCAAREIPQNVVEDGVISLKPFTARKKRLAASFFFNSLTNELSLPSSPIDNGGGKYTFFLCHSWVSVDVLAFNCLFQREINLS